MPIPERFRREPAPDEVVREMGELCDEIEDALERGDDAEPLLERWHRHAGRTCEPHEFASYWKSTDKATFVREALAPVAEFVPNLEYDEARAVLEEVVTARLSEADSTFYLKWLEAQFPGANVSDLIYWPDAWFGDPSLFRDEGGAFKPDAELSHEQMLAYAMARSSRQLPGAPTDVPMPFPLPATE